MGVTISSNSAGTYDSLATQTLGSATGTITFSSISGSYTDLVLVTSTASNISADSNYILCQFNSDTGANYQTLFSYGTGTGVMQIGSAGASSGIYVGRHCSNQYGVGVAHILNYSNNAVYKTVIARGGTAAQLTIEYSGVWRNTSIINSITLTPASATTFSIGSMFTLYGIKAA